MPMTWFGLGSQVDERLARYIDGFYSGTSFPSVASDGDVFFHKTHREQFSYHGGNSVWVGPENVVMFGKGGTSFNNTYLRVADAISSSSKGWLVPNDIMITKVSAVWTTTSTEGYIRIKRDGTNVVSLNLDTVGTSNTTAQSLAVDTNYDKHDGATRTGVMGVYLDSLGTGGAVHGGVGHPVVAVYWRRRET